MSDSSEERLQAVIAAARARRLVRKLPADNSVGGGNTDGSIPSTRVKGEHRPRVTPSNEDEVVCFGALWQSDRDSTSPPTNSGRLVHGLDIERHHGSTDSRCDPWPWLTAQKERPSGIDDVVFLPGQFCDDDNEGQLHACHSVIDLGVTTVGPGLEVCQLDVSLDEDVPTRMEPGDPVGHAISIINKYTHNTYEHARTHEHTNAHTNARTNTHTHTHTHTNTHTNTHTSTNTHHSKHRDTTVE